MAFKPLTVNTPIGEEAHILAEDDAALYDGIFGEDCVLKLGEQFASKTISNNVIRVMDGVVVVGGHAGRIIKGDYEDMMIDNGTADQKRNDLIVARFQSGGTGGADTYSLVVVKGTPGSTAKDPAIVQEDLYAGGKQRDYPLYRVRIENLSVVGVDKLFKVNRNFKVLAEELDKTGEKIDSVNQTLEERTGKELRLYVNKEGGAIEFTEKGTDRKWRMNLLNGVFRLYAERPGDNYCVYSFPTTEAGGKGGTVGTVEQISKKMDKMTVVNNATTTATGTVLDGRMGKTLNDAINSLKNKFHVDNSASVIRIGKLRLKYGSWVATGTGTEYMHMASEATLKSQLGISSFDIGRFNCIVMNGDGKASSLNTIGTQYWSGDGLYCYFNGILKSGAKLRINFVYIYFDE